MKIECPHCGVSGSLDDAFAGRRIRCPKCNGLFQAGGDSERPPSAETDARRPSDDQLPAAPAAKEEEIAETAGQEIGEEPPPVPPEAGAGGSTTGSAQRPAQQPGPPPLTAREEAEAGAPASSLSQPGARRDGEPPGGDFPSERFSVGRILNRSWELTLGVKGPIWGGILVNYGVALVVHAVRSVLAQFLNLEPGGLVDTLLDLAGTGVTAIFTAGLMYMGVLRASGREVGWKDVFSAMPQAGPIIVAALLQILLVGIGFLLLILPGIYLAVGYMLTFPLMVDRGLSPWQAMEASRKAIHKVWWKLLGLYLVFGLICAVSAIPLGIGLIWTLPMSVVLCGVVYRLLFADVNKG